MQTTSGLLMYLTSRLGTVGLSLLLLLAVALALAIGLAFVVMGNLVAAGAEPVQVSPVRWFRHC